MPVTSDSRRIASIAIAMACVLLVHAGAASRGANDPNTSEVRQPVKRVTADLGQGRFEIPRQQRNAPAPAVQPTPPPQGQPMPPPAQPTPPGRAKPKPAPFHDPFLFHHGHYGPHVSPRHSRYLNLGTGIYYSDALYYRGPVTGVYSPIDPNLVIYPPRDVTDLPPPPPTVGDLARGGRIAEAEAMILAEPGEGESLKPESVRLLAVLASIRGDFIQAAGLVEAAYTSAPTLAESAADIEGFFRGPGDFRRLLVRAVRHAQAADDAAGWLLVAAIMQADGRDRDALRMIERASALGLDAEIVDAWLALTP